MKRHPSLAHLSRDHHPALILSQLLKKDSPVYKGLPTGTKEKADYAFGFYKEELAEHFKKEELIVIRIVKGIRTELDQLGEELIAEHKKLRELFEEIKTSGDLINHLDLIGNILEQHIRKEERVFFPMIQEYCEEQLLEKIETLLSV